MNTPIYVFFILINIHFRNIRLKTLKNKKHIRNIARVRFRNMQKLILINKTIFERKYLQNTTNETNVNMFMYKVYLTHFKRADHSIYTFCNCWNALKTQGPARFILFLFFFVERTSESLEWWFGLDLLRNI